MTEDETELGVETESEVTDGGGFGRMLKTILVTGVIVVLGLGVLFLLSERNARRYFLVAEDGQLLVQRGIFFPVGERTFVPDDPDLAAAYEPVPVPAGADVEARRTFDERTDLDRSLVDQLLGWSRERLDLEQPDRLEQGIYYLRRAERLPTTTAAQRAEMDTLRGEVAYFEGRRFIESALRNLDIARERLTQARDSPAGWSRESRELLRAIREPERTLRQALRGAGPEALPEEAAPEAPPETETEPETDPETPAVEPPEEAAPAAETGRRTRPARDRDSVAGGEATELPVLAPIGERERRRGPLRRGTADSVPPGAETEAADAVADDED
jgi:hypothetical protein